MLNLLGKRSVALTGRLDKSTDQTGDNHDNVKEDKGDDVRQRETRSEDEREEKSWRCNNPVDIPVGHHQYLVCLSRVSSPGVPDLPVHPRWEPLAAVFSRDIGIT